MNYKQKVQNKQLKFICECGKSFDKIHQLTGHQTNCKIHKQKLQDEFEIKQLPNRMFKCENPDCNKEHDGSYGSGRFCCKKCANHTAALNAAKTAINRGTKYSYFKTNIQKAKYGTWKCNICNCIFETRRQLYKHRKEIHDCCKSGKAWNKGLTKETSKLIADTSVKVSEGVKKAYSEGKLTGKCKDPVKELERRRKISETMKKNPNAGGKRNGSGHGQQGWYKGYYCDSSWELAVIIYWLDHNIKFSRCTESFEYQIENVKHLYYPDFIFSDGQYVEVKGAENTLQWKQKLKYFPKNRKLIVIGKNEIIFYLQYAEQHYGKNFIKLYDQVRIIKSNQ